MIGLDWYSKQVFIYLDPILIYISLWIDCLFEIRKIAVFPLAFIAGWLQGHWWGFISRNYVVWPTFVLMNAFIALKGSHFWFLFFCLPLLLATFTVPCRIVFAMPEDLEMWPYHLSFRFFTMVRRSSCTPTAFWILLRTSSFVIWSL